MQLRGARQGLECTETGNDHRADAFCVGLRYPPPLETVAPVRGPRCKYARFAHASHLVSAPRTPGTKRPLPKLPNRFRRHQALPCPRGAAYATKSASDARSQTPRPKLNAHTPGHSNTHPEPVEGSIQKIIPLTEAQPAESTTTHQTLS